MLDTILKWWNRKWSNWELDTPDCKVFNDDESKRPWQIYDRYKRTSNDGLVEYKKIIKT
jgi:hypothetical protein